MLARTISPDSANTQFRHESRQAMQAHASWGHRSMFRQSKSSSDSNQTTARSTIAVQLRHK
eukprot:2543104-Amphidinium_carterae.1